MLAQGACAVGRMGSVPAFVRCRRASPAEFGKLLIVATGLVVVICLAIVGILTTSSARAAGRARSSGCEAALTCGYARGPYP